MFHPSLHELCRLCTALIIAIAAVQLNAQIIGYDRLGNGYTAEDLAVPTGGAAQMMGGAGFCNPCSAGIFQLTFLPGSGLEMNTPLGIARQQVAIQVFEDLSVLISLLALVPVLALAQAPATQPAMDQPNAETRAVLLANCPKDLTGQQWLKLMEKPENAVLFPLRVTQAMLDTLDATKLDLRYRYVLVSLHGTASSATAR